MDKIKETQDCIEKDLTMAVRFPLIDKIFTRYKCPQCGDIPDADGWNTSTRSVNNNLPLVQNKEMIEYNYICPLCHNLVPGNKMVREVSE